MTAAANCDTLVSIQFTASVEKNVSNFKCEILKLADIDLISLEIQTQTE